MSFPWEIREDHIPLYQFSKKEKHRKERDKDFKNEEDWGLLCTVGLILQDE